jgi:hypothetical protein
MDRDQNKPEDMGSFSPEFPELPIEAEPARFWVCGSEFDSVEIDIARPDEPLAILEELGPSPFERGGFPVIGFLATTYETVTRYAVERE